MQTVLDLYKKLREKSSTTSSGLVSMDSLVVNDTILFFGFDSARNIRSILINIGRNPWEEDQLKALPKWSGAIVKMEYFEKIGPLSCEYFLTVTQGDEEFGDLFETIIQNLVDYISISDSEELFTTVYKVFERWKSFFKRGGFKRLSDEQQRGLFGELFLINQWIELNPGQPPLLINSWNGPTKGRIDFTTQRSGIEIKTSIDGLSKRIRIANEKQLQITDAVENIYLYVCYLELSKTHGTTLDEMVEKVRERLYSFSQGLVLKFDELLHDLGYKIGEYSEVRINVMEEEGYKIKDDFPMIQVESLPLGISHVSYNVDLSHCNSFKIAVEDIYNLI